MSMLGQNAFQWIDKRLRQATPHYDEPFGGISIILIADFAQLPPVCNRALYNTPNITDDQTNHHAYLLYRQFNNTIVQLKQM